VLNRLRQLLHEHGSVPCVVEFTVHKVVFHRRRDAPVLGWLTGHRNLLFVEVSAPVSQDEQAIIWNGYGELVKVLRGTTTL